WAAVGHTAVEAAEQRFGILRFETRRGHDRLIGLPSMANEILGDAADRVVGIAGQIDPSVVVEVDRVGADAAWHELRQPDGAGVRALGTQRGDILLARQTKELLVLDAEIVGAARVVAGR